MLKSAAAAGGLPEGVSVDARGRLACSGRLDSEAREMVEEASPFVERILPQHSSMLELLLGLFRALPKERLGAAEALQSSFVSAGEVPE